MWVCPCTRHSSESLCSVPCCLCSFLPNCFLLSFESDVNRGPRGWFAPASGHSLSLMPIVIFEVSTSGLPRHLNHFSWRLGIICEDKASLLLASDWSQATCQWLAHFRRIALRERLACHSADPLARTLFCHFFSPPFISLWGASAAFLSLLP